MFPSFVARKNMVKVEKLGQKKALEVSQEGPYLFVGYVNGKEEVDFDEGKHIYIIKGLDEDQWQEPQRDLQLFHFGA